MLIFGIAIQRFMVKSALNAIYAYMNGTAIPFYQNVCGYIRGLVTNLLWDGADVVMIIFAATIVYFFATKYLINPCFSIFFDDKGAFRLYKMYYGTPKVVVEYSLFRPNTMTLIFLVSIAFLIALFYYRDSKRHRDLILTAAAPLAFSLCIKRMFFVLKWETSSIFGEVHRFFIGDSNVERAMTVVFAILFILCLILACSANLSWTSFSTGFVFLSFDVLISKSFYTTSLPFLFPPLKSITSKDSSVIGLIVGLFIAFSVFYLFFICVQAFWKAIEETRASLKEEFQSQNARIKDPSVYYSEPMFY